MVLLSKETCSTCVFPRISINSSPLLQFFFSLTAVLHAPGLVLPWWFCPSCTHIFQSGQHRHPQLSTLWVHSLQFLTGLWSSSPLMPWISIQKPKISPAAGRAELPCHTPCSIGSAYPSPLKRDMHLWGWETSQN